MWTDNSPSEDFTVDYSMNYEVTCNGLNSLGTNYLVIAHSTTNCFFMQTIEYDVSHLTNSSW